MNIHSTRQRLGLILAGVLSLANLPSAFVPTPDGEEGPPVAVLVLSAVLGLIGLVAVIVAWRSGSRVAVRVAAGTLILNVLTSLPAFFVDVSAWIKLVSSLLVLASIAAVVLMFSTDRRSVPVLD